MKRRCFILFLVTISIAALCMPLNAFAAWGVNQEASHYVNNAGDYEKVAPDLHYILDDSKPYQMLFPGTDHLVGPGGWQNLSSYDLVFVQTSGQPLAHFGGAPNIDIAGDNKQISVYACMFGDEEWTPIFLNRNQGSIWIARDQETAWYDWLLASNFDPMNTFNVVVGDYEDYLYYFNIPESKFSVIDYNGNIAYQNIFLTYLKMIGHVFVLKFLKPLIDYIVAEPILLLLVLLGFSVSVISFLIAIYNLIISKGLKRRRKRG